MFKESEDNFDTLFSFKSFFSFISFLGVVIVIELNELSDAEFFSEVDTSFLSLLLSLGVNFCLFSNLLSKIFYVF